MTESPTTRRSALHGAALLFALALLPAAPALHAQMPETGGGAGGMSAMLGPVDGHELPPTEIGRVRVGESAPDFTLERYGGGTFTLSELRGEKNVVLTFYRGHWCPYCVRQLAELRSLLDDEARQDTEIVVLSVEGETETARTIQRVGRDGMAPDFTFVMDREHTVIDRYGVLNPEGSRAGIPHPATYVIDRDGVVRWKDVQTDYKVRPTNEQIRAALDDVRMR